MGDDENTGVNLFNLIKFLFVMFGTLAPASFTAWVLFNVPIGSAQLKSQVLILSSACFFLGSCSLLFSRPSRNKGILWLSGFIVTIGAVVVGGVMVLFHTALSYPIETLVIIGTPTIIVLLLYGPRLLPSTPESSIAPQGVGIGISQRVVKKERLIGAVELTEFPEEHLLNKDPDPSKYQPFFNILRVMVLSNFPVALRYERVRNKMRVLYLTWARNDIELSENLETLADTVKGNLSGFRRKVHSRFQGPTINPLATPVTTYLLGEPLTVDDPRQRIDAISVMADVLLGQKGGIVQIWAFPKRASGRDVQSLEKQYRAESESAQLTISKPRSTLLSGEVQESKTRTNMGAVKKTESLQIQIDRLNNSHLCEVEVSATCWDRDPKIAEKHSRKLAGVLRGTLIPADPQKHLSIETRKNPQEAKRLIEGETVGKTTLLSIEETSVYFSLARNDMGISVADHASFRTNPTVRRGGQKKQTETDGILLGKVLDDSGTPTDDFLIPTNDLTSHNVIGGDIGNGKTVTESNITLELYRLGINFTKLLLSKNEDHLRFLRKVKDILVLTPGDETTTPVRFSFSDFCEGMHVNSVINDTKAIIIAAMPAHGIIKEYMERVIELTFERLGWDREANTPGLPIVLSDFLETLPLIKEEIQYSTRGNEDVWGALYSRFNRLCNSVLNSVFGTTSGITMSELTERPSLILLYALSKDEQSFFVFWFVSRIARYFEAKKKTDKVYKKGLRFNVVLEEAHRVLKPETGIKVDEEHGARQAALETITTTMKESRSAGLGFTIIAPGFSELASAAYGMALNIFMHGRGKGTDRRLIGDQMNCTEDQIRMMGSLPIGEAVVRTASISRPVRVRVNDIVALYPELAPGKPVTDDEIIAHMKPVFDQNPHFNIKSIHALKSLKLKDLKDEFSTVTIDMKSALKLYAVFRQPKFSSILTGIQRVAENGNYSLVALILRNIAKLVSRDEQSLSFYCHHLVWSISHKGGIVSEDDMRLIVGELKQLVGMEDRGLEMLDSLHQRLRIEATRRTRSHEFDRAVLDDELKQAMVSAIQEIEELETPNPTIAESDEGLTDLDRKLDTLVRTDQFSTRFRKQVDIALKGDIGPLVRLLLTFAETLDVPDVELQELAVLLLNQARVVHETAADDGLWVSVHELMVSTIDDSGSEVAA